MKSTSIGRLVPTAALLALALAACPIMASAAAAVARPLAPAATPAATSTADRKAFLKRILPALVSTEAQLRLAAALGVQQIKGRRVNQSRTALLEFDHQVTGGVLGLGLQNEPSIAANPLDDNIVVVFGQNEDNVSTNVAVACSVYISLDGGQTYAYDSDAALAATPNHFCSDPVVRYSPDGQFLYFSYMDVNDLGNVDPLDDTDTVRVEVRNGFDPSTISQPPFDIFTATGGTFVDKPWIAVHTWDADGSGTPFVYATVTRFTGTTCEILFNSNNSFGNPANWTGAALLATSTSCDTANPTTARLLQGSRPAGGPGTQVLVCWYDSGADGWSTGYASGLLKLNKFSIACRSSNDRGANFFGNTLPPDTLNPTNWILAAKDVANEVPFYLGPVPPEYYRWWGSELPAIAIDHLGNAHIAFTYDPTNSADDAESGNVAYIKSTDFAQTVPPHTIYSKWSAKVALGSGSLAQGFPTIVAQKVNQQTKPTIWLGYVDHFRSTALGAAGKNAVYDVRFRKSTTGGPAFAAPVTVTDQSSLSDHSSIGDYIDSVATRHRYHIAWTDNVNANTAFDDATDIFTDRY